MNGKQHQHQHRRRTTSTSPCGSCYCCCHACSSISSMRRTHHHHHHNQFHRQLWSHEEQKSSSTRRGGGGGGGGRCRRGGGGGITLRNVTTVTTVASLFLAIFAAIAFSIVNYRQYRQSQYHQHLTTTEFEFHPFSFDDEPLPDDKLHRPPPPLPPPPPQEPKILLFLTTIFSQSHIEHFECCWPRLLERSKFLREQVDVMIFSNNMTAVPSNVLVQTQVLFRHNPSFRIVYAPQQELDYIDDLRNGKNTTLTVGQRPNMAKANAFQYGANLGMKLGFLLKNKNKNTEAKDSPVEDEELRRRRRKSNISSVADSGGGWFYDYDWIIRINPDVLIRNSTFLRDIMMNSVASTTSSVVISSSKSSTSKSTKPTTTTILPRDRSSNVVVVVDAILVDCQAIKSNSNSNTTIPTTNHMRHRRDVKSRTTQRIHTDFFAIRPNVIADKYQQQLLKNQMQQHQKLGTTTTTTTTPAVPSPNNNTPFAVMSTETWNKRLLNHEATFFEVIRPLMMIGKRMTTPQEESSTAIRWLPNVQPSNGFCRVMGPQSPVVHLHTNFRSTNTTTSSTHSSQPAHTDTNNASTTTTAAPPPPRGEDNNNNNNSNSRNKVKRECRCNSLDGWDIT
mmetsp:Transcript_42026/g.101028  ORF Transcript_42026/g.101028 Transcript_42026/m.101028 type:complete len:619 (+) Transcript_42026:387-2243(+)